MSTFLQFSGGRDSLACLYLLEPRWDEITVVWANTGAAFPETIDQMERVRGLVPYFHELKTHQNIESEGHPVDMLPISNTSLGQLLEGNTGRRFQSRYSCCAAALWIPMQAEMKRLGAKVIIRGEKRADRRKSGLPDRAIADGIEYQFPLADWTSADVDAYLKERGIELPANYQTMSTGLDCLNCTAYLDENSGKLDYMAKHHPEAHTHVSEVLSDLRTTIMRHL